MNNFFLRDSDINKQHFNFSIGREKGKFCFVDAMNRIYKQSIGLIGKKLDCAKVDENNLHVISAFNFVIQMLKYGILPVFVFDGKCPKEKKQIVERRKNYKKAFREKCDEIKDKTSDEYYKNYKKCFSLPRASLNECKKVLDLMGIKYVEALGEADEQCAALSKYYKKDSIGVVTEDWDVLMYGSPVILKDFTFKNSNNITNKISIEALKNICLEKANKIRIENDLSVMNKFTDDDFLNFSILSGSDYTIDDKLFVLDGITYDELFILFSLCDFDIHKMAERIEEKNIMNKNEFIKFMKNLKSIYEETAVLDPKDINIIPESIKKEELIKFLCDEKLMSKEFVSSELESINPSYYSLKKICEELNNPKSISNLKSYQYKHYYEQYELNKKKEIFNNDLNKDNKENKSIKKHNYDSIKNNTKYNNLHHMHSNYHDKKNIFGNHNYSDFMNRAVKCNA
jgi:flap endonuclease-1